MPDLIPKQNEPIAIQATEIIENETAGAVARANPRQIDQVIEYARALVLIDEESAAECFYALKRGKQDGGDAFIEGPSSRFAEIMLAAWGNCEAGSRVVEVGEKMVRVEGYLIDLERNNRIAVEVSRRITSRNGRRYSEDMIQTTANAANSIAIRNAILKGIPKPIWGKIFDLARKHAVGDASTLEAKRDSMLAHFRKLTVDPEEVAKFLDRKSIEEITLEDLGRMRGVANAIRDGDSTVDDAFGRSPRPGGKIGTASKIKGIE